MSETVSPFSPFQQEIVVSVSKLHQQKIAKFMCSHRQDLHS